MRPPCIACRSPSCDSLSTKVSRHRGQNVPSYPSVSLSKCSLMSFRELLVVTQIVLPGLATAHFPARCHSICPRELVSSGWRLWTLLHQSFVEDSLSLQSSFWCFQTLIAIGLLFRQTSIYSLSCLCRFVFLYFASIRGTWYVPGNLNFDLLTKLPLTRNPSHGPSRARYLRCPRTSSMSSPRGYLALCCLVATCHHSTALPIRSA